MEMNRIRNLKRNIIRMQAELSDVYNFDLECFNLDNMDSDELKIFSDSLEAELYPKNISEGIFL